MVFMIIFRFIFAAVRTLAPGFESILSNTIKNHAYTGVFFYCGGDEGISLRGTSVRHWAQY